MFVLKPNYKYTNSFNNEFIYPDVHYYKISHIIYIKDINDNENNNYQIGCTWSYFEVDSSVYNFPIRKLMFEKNLFPYDFSKTNSVFFKKKLKHGVFTICSINLKTLSSFQKPNEIFIVDTEFSKVLVKIIFEIDKISIYEFDNDEGDDDN